MTPALHELLTGVVGHSRCQSLISTVDIAPALLEPAGAGVPRAVVAQALNILLFDQLAADVPEAARYIAELERGARIELDHGAVRTVDGNTGRLPRGYRAIAGVLEPLGFELSGEYPLDRLAMTGRAYTHADHAEAIAQFFVSELHVERLPASAQAAADRVFSASADPVSPAVCRLLDELGTAGHLPLEAATRLLPALLGCFAAQHPTPEWADYATLLEHSAELAWIATEGNRFNHATARVADVEGLARQLKARGYAMKDKVEISSAGSVRQTAVRAALVERAFGHGDTVITRRVPGAFFEFISRDVIATVDGPRLDLRFDSTNAQGIFKMTAAKPAVAA